MPRLYTTLLEKPMLDVLIAHLLRGGNDDPMYLADTLVLLPNRRSCLALKARFAEMSAEKPLILPLIQPLGEVDEDALVMGGLFRDAQLAAALAAVRPAVPAGERLVAIAAEIHAHRLRFGIDPLNMEQAVRLAQEICELMDEMARDGVSAQRVLALRGDRYSEHWQRSLALLKHVLGWWPRWLEAHGLMDAVERRNQLLLLLAAHWRVHPPQTPVIAAGSTGTQPATAELLRVIAELPRGMVVVPGLDVQAPQAVWDAVEPTHPQYWLKQLLTRLEVSPQAVALLDDEAVKGGSFARARMLLESSVPAALSGAWTRAEGMAAALEGFTRIDCQHEWEEAQVVALLLREVLEQPQRTAALVTHDMALSRRVVALMRRYGVTLDSASGQPIVTQSYWRFFHSLSFAASQRQAPLPLLALLKDPLCPLMPTQAAKDRLIGKLERGCFRGLRRFGDVLSQLRYFARGDKVSEQECEALLQLCDRLTPLYQAFGGAYQVKAAALLAVQRQVMDALVESDVDAARVMEDLAAAMAHSDTVNPLTYHALLAQCLSVHKWWPERDGHPRLHVLSPMEARVLKVDRVILGGMNDGIWPHDPGEDAWLNEAMRQTAGLPPRAARQGQEAHDWLMLAAQPEVFVTRARRAGGTDSLPSRWLERLDAYLGYGKAEREGYQQSVYLDWVRARGAVAQVASCLPPKPCPPKEARPRELSVTGMEQLLRNPYGAYARYVLGLKPLREIDEELSASTLGEVLHLIFERFVQTVNADAANLNEAALHRIIDEVLAAYDDQPQIVLFWQPRMVQIVPWVLQMERERRADSTQVLAEQQRVASFTHEGETLSVSARIDRMEARDGRWRLIDYKSGKAPEAKVIRAGYACQLPLSALIAAQEDGSQSDELEYWELGGGYRKPEVRSLAGKDDGIDGVMDLYREGLLSTIDRYYTKMLPYYAIPVPLMRPRFDDYAHLARIAEWLSGVSDTD